MATPPQSATGTGTGTRQDSDAAVPAARTPGDDGWAVPAAATLSARDMVRRFAEGSLTPTEVLDAVAETVSAREPVLHAFWVLDLDVAREQAEASTARWQEGRPVGPLDGVPVTLKENLARAGVPMPAGNAGAPEVVPEHDAPVTARVREAGGLVLGSTVMPDWGMLSSGVSSKHGITRSPWDPAWTTGGSSAGAGAAAAGGYGPLHVGTDIGGSIRLPATWLALASLKPSAGRVPLDTPYLGRAAGPLARTVGDVAMLMSVVSRPDPRDWTALPPQRLDWKAGPVDPAGLRVGLHLDAGCGADVDPRVRAAVERVADALADAGAQVEPLDPFCDQGLLDSLDRFWRVRSYRDLLALPAEQQEQVLPYVAAWCRGGADVGGTEVLGCYADIMTMQQRTVAATEAFDVVVSPVCPGVAFPAEQEMPVPDPDATMSHIGFTAPYNMSGQPAATVNAGFTEDGRPIGVHVGGRRFDDVGVLRVAAWWERHRPADAVPPWPDDRVLRLPDDPAPS